ncbi:MAG: restriction endonuclease subunit S [Roseburia sp.]
MSKIDELIEALCPEGVPFKKLGEIGYFYGGLTGKSKDDFKDGNAVFITYMNVFSNIELKTDVTDRVRVGEKEKQNTVQYGDVLFTGSSETPDECGMSSVLTTHTDEKLYLNSFCFGYRFNDPEMFLPGFTKHLFRSDDLRYQITRTASGVTRFNVSKKKMEDVRIPVPPKELQREIVHVLDEFTLLTSELSAELTSELSARRKQYEYYRNEMLTFDTSIPKIPLSDVTVGISSGKNKERLDDGTYPVYGSTGIISQTNTPVYDWQQILVARVGANAGFVHLADGKYDVSDNTLIVDVNKEHSLKYVYYLLQNMNLNQYAKGGGQPLITAGDLKKMSVPMPKRDVQDRIVNVLDNFDAICSNLKIGLPAEINARQKQYEYYRDLLLTFVETGKTILTDRQTDRQTDRA